MSGRCIAIDIDDTLTPELVILLNLLPDEIQRVVVTARHATNGADESEFDATWTELVDMGLRFDELHMRPRKWGLSPARFKARVIDELKGWGLDVLLAIDDNPSVTAHLRKSGVPVLKVHP